MLERISGGSWLNLSGLVVVSVVLLLQAMEGQS